MGGASFIVAKEIVKQFGIDNVTLVFCDTLIEDEDLYRFLDDIEKYFNKKIIRLKDGRTPFQVYEDVNYFGNSRIAHCSVTLKGKVFSKWIRENYNPKDCVIHFGFDGVEYKRLEGAKKNWFPYECQAPLLGVEKDGTAKWTKQLILEEIEDCGIAIPRLYDLGFSHNNCGGFCCKAGQKHFDLLRKKLPEKYKEFEEITQDIFDRKPNLKPHIKQVVNGVSNYLTMKDFRESMEAGELPDSFVGGCGCFSDSQLMFDDSEIDDKPDITQIFKD